MVIRVPFVDLAAQESVVADDAIAAIRDVAREAKFVLGARVAMFEEWLARTCESSFAIGVASGSDALELSLRACGIGEGDAVVTPAISFIAAAEAIVAVGARPVFCDIDPVTMNASEETVVDAIVRARRAGLRVRALLPVHLFGLSAPLKALRSVAVREDLVLIEDAAQAIGARDEDGRVCASVGDAGCFSFFPTKNLGAWGDGGAVVTSREGVAERVRRLRAHGAQEPYVHAELGRNSRLDAIQAAILLAKAKHLGDWQEARGRIAQRYRSELSELPLTLPVGPEAPSVHVWHAFVVRCAHRDALASALRDRGVEARVYYPLPLHRQPCFAPLKEPSLPVAEELCGTALALPVYPALREEQQTHVIEQLKSLLAR